MVASRVDLNLGRIGCNYYSPNLVNKFHIQPGSTLCKRSGTPPKQVSERKIAASCIQFQCGVLAIALREIGLRFGDIPSEMIQE